jgi:hypothetical protein
VEPAAAQIPAITMSDLHEKQIELGAQRMADPSLAKQLKSASQVWTVLTSLLGIALAIAGMKFFAGLLK